MPEPSSQPTGSAVRPLWVIAISLATIAVCLVLLVIKQHFNNVGTKSAARAQETSRPAVRNDDPADRVFPKRAFDTTRQPLETAAAPEVVRVTVPVPVVTPAAPAFPPERPGGGVLAPVVTEAAPNTMTAISGRVTLRGTPPPETQFFVVDDPSARPQDRARQTRNFLVGPDGGLADVFVSIKDFPKKDSFKPPRTKHEIAFAKGQIQPFTSAAMVNQRFVIRNTDDHAHRLTIALPDMSPFVEIPLSSRSDVPFGDFLRTPKEFLRLQCKLHPWEIGYLTLTDHPFFSITDTNGNFVIANVPPGKYTLTASHPKIQGTNGVTREVVVRANEITQVSLTMNSPKDQTLPPRVQAQLSERR